MSEQDYQAIADRLVGRGILDKNWDEPITHWNGTDFPKAEEICHDWRVAGACMERMTSFEYQVCRGCIYTTIDGDDYGFQETESLPLAIILAYLEGTDGDGSH